MEHEMILFSADFKTVCARLTARRKQASEAHLAEHLIRTQEDSVQFRAEAPLEAQE